MNSSISRPREPSRYRKVAAELSAGPQIWLVTGCAGFIGSNLLEALLKLDQVVVGLDNFATGFRRNLVEVRSLVAPDQWARFDFIEGDIRDLATCRRACDGVHHVLHQAALGSVPRSINDPIASNQSNIDGFLNMLVAGRDAGVASFTYAASSSTYGDHPALPKVEDRIGMPLSPYAVTKFVNELYAHVFALNYGFKATGLRYFNCFGKRQNRAGPYAAVISNWIAAMIRGEPVRINGDGRTSRDFTYVENAVQANILAATADDDARGQVYNTAVGDQTSLNRLFEAIRATLAENGVRYDLEPAYGDFRAGDVRHSLADISKAQKMLGYQPTHDLERGLGQAMSWFIESLRNEVPSSPPALSS